MKTLFLFLDGIGLGADNSETNPFVRANMPHLESLLGGKKLTGSAAPFENEHLSLMAADPNLGVKGLPQSATGQAVLLTGINIPAELGYHYGPKPNPEVAQYLNDGTLFSKTVNAGKKTALLNAYPPRYFDGIDSGKRLYSSIPLALTNAGIPFSPTKIITKATPSPQISLAKAGVNFLAFQMRPSSSLRLRVKSSASLPASTISLSLNIGQAITRDTNRICPRQYASWRLLIQC